jgi:hypothetical protein
MPAVTVSSALRELPTECSVAGGMDAILGFIFGVGGLVVLGVAAAFVVGWYIVASRAKKLKETS